MESEKFIMAAGVSAAVIVGAFVFWGPNQGSQRMRQRRGEICGLQNFGKTCFLNSLIQGLSACPQFIGWLQLHNNADKKSLISSLQTVLEVVNGTHATIRADPFSPATVIRALNSMGWVIPPDEHDPHELMHAILSSMEEELQKPKKLGCLSDALGDANILSYVPTMPPPRPSSAMLTDFDTENYNESTNLIRLARSEINTPESPLSSCTDNDIDNDNSLLDDALTSSPPSIISTLRSGRSRTASTSQNGDALSRRLTGSCRSLERLTRGPGRVSVWSDKITKQIPPPFRGGLSSQMICSLCAFKSVVRLDKFDSITLNLPESKVHGLSLAHLLTEFVASETLQGVECEACNQTTQHTKTLTFGKLPPCLCIHISRTAWMSGRAYKRPDYLHFPESLSMAPYSFIQPGLSTCSTPWGSTMSLYSASLANSTPTNEQFYGNPFSMGGMFPRNLYRLLAVVVHSGDANTGHFVTYRRGALRNSHKWFYTSDTIVKEVSIDEVLSVPAYLLFYDRGGQSTRN